MMTWAIHETFREPDLARARPDKPGLRRMPGAAGYRRSCRTILAVGADRAAAGQLADERREIYNQRYSPLTEITVENVSQLKCVWRTRLRGSGVGAQYSGSAQPIVYDGVIYVITGANDVFALAVSPPECLWLLTRGGLIGVIRSHDASQQKLNNPQPTFDVASPRATRAR
jgi:hypothetical protein